MKLNHEIMSFAIYEIVGLIIALPLSYTMAALAKKFSTITYKEELDHLFYFYWNGEADDEKNAWLKVLQLISSKKGSRKKIKYIINKLQLLNKQDYQSHYIVTDSGELKIADDYSRKRVTDTSSDSGAPETI